jgi:hypothetical protein
MQQPADFFCKEILPEHHRLEDPSPFTIVDLRFTRRNLGR